MLDADVITVKCIYKYPVPHVTEIRRLLSLIPDFHPVKCALGLIGMQAMRPIELTHLRWRGSFQSFFFDLSNTFIVKMRHLVFKPKNTLTTAGQKKRMYKEVEKPMFSEWLSRQLIGHLERYGDFFASKTFPWNTTDPINKFFSDARKNPNMVHAAPFLLDKNIYPVKGQSKTQYRICPYAFRRFAFTFHYWVTFNQDIVALAQCFGHTRPETTLQHYIFPKESIGLTDDMIQQKISFDEFLFIGIPGQNQLRSFIQKPTERIAREPGQRSIMDFDCLV